MSWDYEFARRIRKDQGRTQTPALLEGTVVSADPLTISLYGGEVMAPPMALRTTSQTAGLSWAVGEKALCACLGKALILLDKLT